MILRTVNIKRKGAQRSPGGARRGRRLPQCPSGIMPHDSGGTIPLSPSDTETSLFQSHCQGFPETSCMAPLETCLFILREISQRTTAVESSCSAKRRGRVAPFMRRDRVSPVASEGNLVPLPLSSMHTAGLHPEIPGHPALHPSRRYRTLFSIASRYFQKRSTVSIWSFSSGE